jgi:hypothetical protein
MKTGGNFLTSFSSGKIKHQFLRIKEFRIAFQAVDFQ